MSFDTDTTLPRAPRALLVCPRCQGVLQAATSAAVPGAPSLRCESCAAPYPLLDGMPCLLAGREALSVTAQAFARQWSQREANLFEKETIYGETAAEELQSCLDRFEIRAATSLAGKAILDIGCGSGRLTQSLALYAPDAVIVGGELSDAAHIAFRRCTGLANVAVAQLDLMQPPFAPASFDYVYADGVLPHVPDPHAALARLALLVRPGGKLFVWIYPPSFSPYRLTRDVFAGSYRWPHALQVAASWGVGLPLHAAFKAYELSPTAGRDSNRGSRRAPRRRSLREVVFMLHDNLVPQYQHRATPAELGAEFERLGFTAVRHAEPATGIVGTKS